MFEVWKGCETPGYTVTSTQPSAYMCWEKVATVETRKEAAILARLLIAGSGIEAVFVRERGAGR